MSNVEKLIFPEGVLDQHLVVLGKTGAGKSSALRHIVEHLLSKNKRVCIIDPKGDWHGLKVGADGNSPGFPVIGFGDFKNPKAQDVPINSQSGKHVAELITSGNRPAIIGFRGWFHNAMTKFWIDFASTVFSANSGELYLVGDEFHNFAPKGKILGPEAGKCLHWSNRLLSEGRGLGLICLIASQRPQKVHNDTLTSCETLVAMRVIHKADRDAVKDWIDGAGDPAKGKEVLESLASLPRGEGYIWSPEIGYGPKQIQFPMFTTFDSFAPPQLQHKVSSAGWADINLDQVNEKLASVIEEAKANNPTELRKQMAAARSRIVQLEREATTKTAMPAKIVEKHVLKDGQIEKLDNLIGKQMALMQKAREIMDEVKMQSDTISSAIRLVRLPIPQPHRGNGVKVSPRPIQAPRVKAPATDGVDTESPSGPEQRILDSLAWLASIGVNEPETAAVAFLAGYTTGGGAFNNPRGALRGKGLIKYLSEDKLCLTDAGAALAIIPEEVLTKQKLHEKVLERLPGPEQKLLKPLLDSYPAQMTNEELAEASGYATGGGAYNNPRGRLRTLGLIEYRDGNVVARSILFPCE